ncbi:MAG: archaellum operon transcriptional activator EarA family protein [Candidatus Paceibacterota bacterium]
MSNPAKDILDTLFDSRIRVKVLKFLFRNYPNDFSVSELSERIQESPAVVRKEMSLLSQIKLIKKNGTQRYALNSSFEFFQELMVLIMKSSPAEKNMLVKRIQKLGKIRLALLSGIFLNNGHDNAMANNSVVDLFIVGDDISKERLRSFLKSLEAEVGREIRLSIMDKEEFEYRFGMFDRFVRVMLESPHEKIINKLGL